MINIDDIPKNNAEIIRSSVLFGNLKNEEINRAMDLLDAEIRTYGKGEFLCRPFSGAGKFGLVLSGVVQVCNDDIEGNRIIMAEVTSGKTFGESLCFLEIKDSPVFIYSSEPSEILWLSVRALFGPDEDELCTGLRKQFTAMLALRALAMNDRIQVLSKVKLRDKLLTYLNQQSEAAGSQTFQIPVNRDDMAAYIGTNRSALSRELSQMKKEGLIDYYKNTFRIFKSR